MAARLGEVMEAVGGDGLLFSRPNVNRRIVAQVADGPVPALQRPSLTRRWYEHATFRENLLVS